MNGVLNSRVIIIITEIFHGAAWCISSSKPKIPKMLELFLKSGFELFKMHQKSAQMPSDWSMKEITVTCKIIQRSTLTQLYRRTRILSQ